METIGPWVVSVLEIDSDRFSGSVEPELATEIVPGKETLTDISSRTGSLAAVNGGYFVVHSEDGTEGDPAGVSVADGELISEAVGDRTSLVLPSRPGKDARVAEVSSAQEAYASSGARREVDGLNRKPGLVRSCGGVGGDQPTELPKHDVTCTDESEPFSFTPDFGATTETGEGAEAVLDSSGRVMEFRERRGGEIPSGGTVLSGTGKAADWLREHAREEQTVSVSTELLADEEPLSPEDVSGIVNGGPRLLYEGETEITADAEGFDHAEDPGFYNGFGTRRNPRTLAGVKPDGTLLLATVEGSQPGYSVGASFEESAGIMRSLGAEEAVNLDGGGSTTLTGGESLLTLPSDETGERPLGDAIVVLEETLPYTGGMAVPSTDVEDAARQASVRPGLAEPSTD